MDEERLQELKTSLERIANRGYRGDPESDHIEADQLLLDYIADPDVERLFDYIKKWYA